MPEIEQILANEDFKNKAAAVVAGALVIVAGFLVYNYFSKIGEGGELQEQAAIEEQSGLEEIGSLADEELGKTDETSKEEGNEEKLESLKEVKEKEEAVTTPWQATNYVQGDIVGENYTVKEGDTLWEIAEARYGSGFEWGKILEANRENIGFLPNGSQALIEPGQVLVLP